MAIKKTHEQFLLELNQRNLNFPDYQIKLVENELYSNLDTKLKFECLNGHPIFESSPRYIITKQSGCPKCGSKRTGHKNLNNHDSFLQKLAIRNKQYSPVLLVPDEQYNGIHSKLKFQCADNKHPIWEATASSIIQGSGCPICGNQISKITHQHTHSQFLELLNLRNEEYPLKQVFLSKGQTYTTQKDKLEFYCNHNHTWNTIPGDIIHRKIGCPFCAASKTFSFMAIDWLSWIAESNQIDIIHRGNTDNEYIIPTTKYSVDGYCKETNTVYEFHGNYWHGNPRLFDCMDTNERTNTTFGSLYDKTIARENHIKSLGYNIVTIWEDEYDVIKQNRKMGIDFNKVTQNLNIDAILIPISKSYDRYHYLKQLELSIQNNKPIIFIFEDEWKNNKKLIETKLQHYSSTNNVTKIHARKCEIIPISNADKKDLLNNNHIQGNDNAILSYGAYYEGKLVSVMTFTPPRVALGQKDKTKSKNGIWELSRFCTDVSYRIPGIASKLLTHFKRHNNWVEIYSFADRRWSVGNMYHQLGFELVSTNPPSYHYVVNGQRKHRWNYRKDILKNTLSNYDATLTEYENMQNNGFWRVWDCGTTKFSMKNQSK